MKKINIVIIFMFGVFSVYSQTQITLTFSGKDSISQNPLSLDSVYVKNLWLGCDTMLYGPSPELVLMANWFVGIHETSIDTHDAFVIKQVGPNPFQGSTAVSIYRDHQGQLNLMLFDGMGIKLAEYHQWLEEGTYSFVISSSGNKVVFLSASDNKNHKSVKFVCNSQNFEGNSIKLFGVNHSIEKSTALNLDNSGFTYTMGDQMMFTAYVNGHHENTKFDKPTTNTSYIFTMVPLNLIALPSVITAVTHFNGNTTALSGGTVTSDGGAPVTARGVCWSTLHNPTLADSYTIDGTGIGTYISLITGLSVYPTYYVRVYATNSAGTSYGNEYEFSWY